MPAKTGSRNGLSYGWALGENNWNTGMDGNLTFIDRFGVHLSFKSFLNTPPGSPAAGDCHVIDTVPTGAWVGKAGQVAVYDDGAWRYGVPRTGWRAYCEADERLYVYDGGWVPTAGEWTASTVSQAEAEAGTATTRCAWTAERVRQAIAAWWESAKGALVGPIGITANSSSPALTITQTGTGDCLRVEDETSPDSTPFVIRADGGVSLGGNGTPSRAFVIQRPFNQGTSLSGISVEVPITAVVTNQANIFASIPAPEDSTFTLSSLRHFYAIQGSFGASATVGQQKGFEAASNLTGAINNYGFYGNIPAGAGRWNFYANGTAPNYFAGNVTANAGFNQTPTRSTVASGSTVTLTTSTNHLLYDQAATVAALTVTLPSVDLTDGQIINICTRSAITALTIKGGTIYGAPTTLTAGGFCSFIYSSAASAWFRRG